MHAYLIIAHNNPLVLKYLLNAIDDERNDIYIQIDKKSKLLNPEEVRKYVKKSGLFFPEREKVYWSDVSTIEAELNLFKCAKESTNNYSYYHLISGNDFPLKSQNEIHDFFSKNKGKEFIGYSSAKFNEERINKITLFTKYQRFSNKDYHKRFLRKISYTFLKVQRFINYNRPNPENFTYRYGAEWVSITDDFVTELIKNKKMFLKLYKYSACPDEIYKQTHAFNTSFKDKIYDINDELNGCQRFIDWHRGKPYTFKEDDFDLLINSDKMFARKFDQSELTIIEKLSKHIKS